MQVSHFITCIPTWPGRVLSPCPPHHLRALSVPFVDKQDNLNLRCVWRKRRAEPTSLCSMCGVGLKAGVSPRSPGEAISALIAQRWVCSIPFRSRILSANTWPRQPHPTNTYTQAYDYRLLCFTYTLSGHVCLISRMQREKHLIVVHKYNHLQV